MPKPRKRALLISTVGMTIDSFCMPNIAILKELGYDVDVASNFIATDDKTSYAWRESLAEQGVMTWQVDFTRDVKRMDVHLKSYEQLQKLIQHGHYTFVHTNTPIASTIARIACNKTHTPCIYTAHGFHFYEGAPLLNWLLWYPLERYLSRYTDVLITINREDYDRAMRLHARKVVYTPGVGVDTKRFMFPQDNICSIREDNGCCKDDFIIASVGEVNDNKNHQVIVRAIAQLRDKSIKYWIIGNGPRMTDVRVLAESLGIEKQVLQLGYRKDIPELLHAADIFAFPSRREGLGLAAIEAMASGLPLITSNAGGIKEYSIDGVTGYSFDPDDVVGFMKGINSIKRNPALMRDMAKHNVVAAQQYDISNYNAIMKDSYLFMDKFATRHN